MKRKSLSPFGAVVSIGLCGVSWCVSFEVDVSRTGCVTRLRMDDERLGATPESAMLFDVKVDDRWLVGGVGERPRLVERSRAGQALVLRHRVGDIEVVSRIRVNAGRRRVARSFELINRGGKSVRIGGFWFTSLGIDAGRGALYGLPRKYPPRRYGFDRLQPGHTKRTSVKLAPVIVELSPRRSVVFVSDSRRDHVSAGVREREGGVTVTQGFDVLGWLAPGARFTDIGTAYLQVVEGDYGAALHSLWDWMDEVGLRTPADRPQWFQDAVLYSFHPGGTIGSQFTDLGGFRAARERLLPRLPRLGVNAIWLLPVEDQSPYWPRDYYKFQDGLGSAGEFEQLVRRAHDLGLHVLQDIVPHGGSNTNARAKAHPEWLAYDLKGRSLSYWCFDFRHPEWQRYMAGVAEHYVREFDVDGYRVDACAGSKMPNWATGIPYQRASQSLLEGGLTMLASIRAAVKKVKPEVGGLLAETQGAPYAAVADAVYDFTFCNSIIQDWRDLPADEFVGRIRRWLEEEQCTDPRGAIHLRHIENHDTLRAQGWFGIRGMRLMAALMAWIHGMPMVYHNMEVGHEQALADIYRVRGRLPELRRGEAHYEAVAAQPAAVFAFVRNLNDRVALPVLNFGVTEAEVRLSWQPQAWLPGEGPWLVRDTLRDAVVARGGLRELQELRLSLPALGYTVLAVSSAGEKPAVVEERTSSSPADSVSLSWSHGSLPGVVQVGGAPVMEVADVVCPLSWRVAGRMTRALPIRFQRGALQLAAAEAPGGIRLSWDLDVPETSGDCALMLRLRDVGRYAVHTADGVLSGSPFSVSREPGGRMGSIYWRPQGGSAFYDSWRTPLHPADPWLEFSSESGWSLTVRPGRGGPSPVAVQLHDRYLDREGLFAAVYLRRETQEARQGSLLLTARQPEREERPLRVGRLSARQAGPWWVVENDHYRCRIYKTGGVLRELIDTQGRSVVSGGSLYTDVGLCSYQGGHRQKTAAEFDVESSARAWLDGGRLYLRFEGQFRGRHRFAKLQPPLEWYTEWAFDDSPTMRHTWGWRSGRGLHGENGFLAAMWRMPEWRQFVFTDASGRRLAGQRQDDSRRTGETKLQQPPLAVQSVEVMMKDGARLRLADIQTSPGSGFSNVFFHGEQFFLAWLDGPHQVVAPDRWCEATALLSLAPPVAPLPRPEWRAQTSPQTGNNAVRDGSFERSGDTGLASMVDGHVVGWRVAGGAWLVPAGGEFTRETAHDGRLSAKVVNTNGGYLLFRQQVSIVLTAGARYRLSAWVRGKSLVRGADPWRTGSLRVAFTTKDGMRYAEVAALLGDFEWKLVSGIVEVPEGATRATVDVGVNGGTGTMWIDDVKLEPA